jgi:hypothetical protein
VWTAIPQVGTHGAALIYGFFMRRGSAVVEIRPHGFMASWAENYSQRNYDYERAVRFFHLDVGPNNWLPGDFEKASNGANRQSGTGR